MFDRGNSASLFLRRFNFFLVDVFFLFLIHFDYRLLDRFYRFFWFHRLSFFSLLNFFNRFIELWDDYRWLFNRVPFIALSHSTYPTLAFMSVLFIDNWLFLMAVLSKLALINQRFILLWRFIFPNQATLLDDFRLFNSWSL